MLGRRRASLGVATLGTVLVVATSHTVSAQHIGASVLEQTVQVTAACNPRGQISFLRGRGSRWHRQPGVIILSRSGDDRIELTRLAVDYWNVQLAAAKSGLRLGPIKVVDDIKFDDEAYVEDLSAKMMRRERKMPAPPPQNFREFCGNIVVVLAANNFISFARPILRYGIVIAAIKGGRHPPLDLPNVLRNVIAHEIGHAIGLGHNSDRTMLMCGRPAPCRPTKYFSTTKHFFPLTEEEKGILRDRYQVGWRGDR